MPFLCSGRWESGIRKLDRGDVYRKHVLRANHRARECALEVHRTGIRVLGDLQELRNGQSAAAFAIQHQRKGRAAVSSDTQRQRPGPGSSLIWRRCGGGVGNRCRWADRFAMSEQRQSMERHFQRSRELFRTDRGRPCPREWEDPQAKRCGGMERSGSLCGRVAAPRETLHGRQCGSIGKQLRVSKSGPGVPDC